MAGASPGVNGLAIAVGEERYSGSLEIGTTSIVQGDTIYLLFLFRHKSTVKLVVVRKVAQFLGVMRTSLLFSVAVGSITHKGLHLSYMLSSSISILANDPEALGQSHIITCHCPSMVLYTFYCLSWKSKVH